MNSQNLGKFDSIDAINIAFFVMGLIDVVAEFLLGQLMKPESEYSLLSQKQIGIKEDNGGVTDNSSDIDSNVSSEDDDVSSNHPSTLGSSEQRKGMSSRRTEHFKKKFRAE